MVYEKFLLIATTTNDNRPKQNRTNNQNERRISRKKKVRESEEGVKNRTKHKTNIAIYTIIGLH